MSNITIDDGREAITINGDPNRVIYVQASDFNIKVRANKARENIHALLEQLDKADPKDDAALADILEDIDKKVREQINFIFNDDVSTPVFGACSPLMSLKSGKSYVEAFLDAILPEIEKIAKKAAKASEKRIAKHAARYAK